MMNTNVLEKPISRTSKMVFLKEKKIFFNPDIYINKGLNKNWENIFTEKKHAVLGISPQNGYYTKEKIYKIIQWANFHFEKVIILSGEDASYYNFLSRGYNEKKAHEKCKEQDRLINNRILYALETLGLKEKIKILKKKIYSKILFI